MQYKIPCENQIISRFLHDQTIVHTNWHLQPFSHESFIFNINSQNRQSDVFRSGAQEGDVFRPALDRSQTPPTVSMATTPYHPGLLLLARPVRRFHLQLMPIPSNPPILCSLGPLSSSPLPHNSGHNHAGQKTVLTTINNT